VAKGKLYVGTSGWNYKHWMGNFYPEDLKAKDWLRYYSQKLRTVEINNSFYRLPDVKTFKSWKDSTPENFLFSIKGSRYITHMKKLKDPEESTINFFARIKYLDKKLGVILFQLPPQWRFNQERLEEFLRSLPEKYKYTFEFRDQSWWNEKTLKLLKDHNCAFCIYELTGTVTPKEITADFIYVRLHGPGDKYQGCYREKELSDWAGIISDWQKNNKDVYIYFDNDDSGYAVQNAMELQEMISF
jgi:uncharacterized protein YecE (DUF72 family)